jgi:hypothetical protein
MSNSRDVLVTQIADTLMIGEVIYGDRGDLNQVADEVLDSLFQSNNWEVIQKYLNERVIEELPDRFDPRDVAILGGDPSL